VLEAARILSQYQFKSTIVFIGWGGEEGWMKGSWDYVNNVVKKNTGPGADPNHLNVAGVLNLDMILAPFNAKAPNAPLDLDIGTRVEYPECAAWADKFRAAGTKYSPSIQIDATHGSDYYEWYASDQGPFMKAEDGYRYPGLMIAENTCNEIWGGSNPWYHQASDASDMPAGARYDYQFAANVVKIVVGMVAEEAQLLPSTFQWKGGGTNPTNWGGSDNWTPVGIPSGPGSKVAFGNQSTDHSVVDMASEDRTVGSITFAAGRSTTIQSTSGHRLILDAGGGIATIDVAGNHTISAPLVLDSDAIVSGTGVLDLVGGVTGSHKLTVLSNVTVTSVHVDALTIGGNGATAVPEPNAFAMMTLAGLLFTIAYSRKTRRR
jgi:hypothetical protein